jgi:hypothetical protein
MAKAADEWNRSSHSFSFSVDLSSLSLSPTIVVSISPLSMYASPLLVLKKLWHVHIYNKQTGKKRSGQPPPACVRAMISSLSFSLLSKDGCRGAHKAHSAHIHSLYLSFHCLRLYLHSNTVNSKSFYCSWCAHTSTILCFLTHIASQYVS